jgi:ribonuclease HI
MSLEIHTDGSCTDGKGIWSYTIKYRDRRSRLKEVHSDRGQETGTTDIQMRLMAILEALTYVRSMNPVEPITVRSDCSLCVKCITKEYDCASNDAFKRDKVTRGFVQYLQEIWWKMSGLDVRFETEELGRT